jgi:hypothetical protein
MKKRVLILLLVLVALASYASTVTAAATDAIETTSSGMINWTSGEIFATGIGAPPSYPTNAAQARAMTERAAYVVALRNLLETVKGVRVDSESIVENFMVKSDVIKTRVDGIVKGARIVKTRYLSDGSVEVQVGIPLRGSLMDAVIPETFGKPGVSTAVVPPVPTSQKPSQPVPPPAQKPAEPSKPSPLKPQPAVPAPTEPEKKPEPLKPSLPPTATKPELKPEPVKPAPQPDGGATTVFKGGVATGLVVDGRGLNLRPALLPKIVDPQGQELYVGQVATRTNAVEQGVAGYARDVSAASNNFRVTDNPAVIKGTQAAGLARTDIMVSQADAQTLRQLGDKGNFLQYCRVIIVY